MITVGGQTHRVEIHDENTVEIDGKVHTRAVVYDNCRTCTDFCVWCMWCVCVSAHSL
jgi:very-short-patch-repair endonuclease